MINHAAFLTYIFYYFILSSFGRTLFVMFCRQISPKREAELRVRYIVNYGFFLDFFHLLAVVFIVHSGETLHLYNFLFFGFDFALSFDYFSIGFLIFSLLILNITARFSLFYLSRDVYYFKFFSLLYVLQLAILLLVLSRSLESLFVGWELLGISSVLLIAFYEHRMSVLKNSLRVLLIYKISDLFFYTALIFAAYTGIHDYVYIDNEWMIGFILLACLIKSSLFPWFWLPRAMEGPTPSSAIFYGALATHIPVYILLNIAFHHPHGLLNPVSQSIFICFILISASCSSMLGRQVNDVKNSIAYATIAQLGAIYIEVLLGFYHFAVLHIFSHAVFRAFEFFRSPSQIYIRHSIARNYKNKIIHATGLHYELLLPKKIRNYFYRIAYHEFYLPKIIMGVIDQFLALNTSYINRSALKLYVMITLLLYVFTQMFILFFFHESFSYIDEIMFVTAYLFNILAMMNKYLPKMFFASISLSVFSIINILFEKIHPDLKWVNAVLLAIFIVLFIRTIMSKVKITNRLNYAGRVQTTQGVSYLILLAGLAIIGAPGCGTFFIWSHLEHLFITKNPGLIIQSFLLLTLNTIVFFRFYYANYLGRYDKQGSYETVRLI